MQGDNTTPEQASHQPLEDEYMQNVILLANMTNRVHNGLEKILEIEEAKQSHFLNNLIEIETWLDGVASRQEKRLAYIKQGKDIG